MACSFPYGALAHGRPKTGAELDGLRRRKLLPPYVP